MRILLNAYTVALIDGVRVQLSAGMNEVEESVGQALVASGDAVDLDADSRAAEAEAKAKAEAEAQAAAEAAAKEKAAAEAKSTKKAGGKK